jgi:exopolyphosphatase/guanosine-5'-triphosphate,3'-diphosphate pyrophosphatase
MGSSGTRIAVIDLGTNSTRLLVAEVEDGEVHELTRQTEITRLGEGVDANGRLGDRAMDRVFDVLSRYREELDRLEAEEIVAVATSAVRDADNGEEFRQELRERFGIHARTIPGEQEARLTFLGATATLPSADAPTLVLDIGGGSTEFVVGAPRKEPSFHVSTDLGAVRQTERHLHDDPPTGGQLDRLRAEVREVVAGEVPADVRSSTESGIAVAGTATSVAAIDLELEPYDSERVEGHPLERETTERILGMLAALPLVERRRVRGLHPGRAPTIVAGVAILIEAMEAFGLDRMTASEADILHGAALTRSGDARSSSDG